MRRLPIQFLRIYGRLTADKRVNAWHISLLMAILTQWDAHSQENPVAVTRRLLMALAKMQSCMTYHKCISQLQEFGFIKYRPSFHPHLGSSIFIVF